MTHVPVFRNAWKAFTRNYLLDSSYVAAILVVTSLFHAYDAWARIIIDGGPIPYWLAALGIPADLIYVAAISAAQATIFAALGAEIDRPLWKCSGIPEALRRYFLPWFILGLLAMTTLRLFLDLVVAEHHDAADLLNFLRLVLYMFIPPVGTCIVFHQGLKWSQLPRILAPISRQIGLTLGVMFIGFIQWTLELTAMISIPERHADSPWILAAINLPLALLECYAFIAMWHICMLDRDEMIAPSPDDFDL